jgi:hypothetical protein
MPILRVQHVVPNFEAWKRAFDSDPIAREASGVRGYTIQRAVENPNFVMIDLEFDVMANAERFLAKLRQLWAGYGDAVMRNPEVWIVETVESRTI